MDLPEIISTYEGKLAESEEEATLFNQEPPVNRHGGMN